MVDGRLADRLANLVHEHHAVLFAYAYRLAGNAADAEDLTQQTYLQAQIRLDQLRTDEAARSWLMSILRNCYLHSVRRRQPVPAATALVSLDELPDDAAEDTPVDLEQLQAALDQLPDEFRIVVLMFYFEGCSYREIAEQLDIPAGTVMSRLSRAKSHLRRRLSGGYSVDASSIVTDASVSNSVVESDEQPVRAQP